MRTNHVYQWLRHKGVWVFAAAVLASAVLPVKALAAGNDFNIQVSPSPIVVTVKPDATQTASLNIRNNSAHPETLYPKLTGFEIDKASKNVKLLEAPPLGIDQWVAFSAPSITIAPGAVQVLRVTFHPPSTAGFSYTAAVTLSRSQNDFISKDGLQLHGAVAVFCLINIDRPDAKRQLSIDSFKADRHNYQFLPATFTLTVKNNGNVIDQPKGNIFIQRSFSSSSPIATLPVNTNSNYVLPGTSREFTTSWNDGFPLYVNTTDGKRRLSWDWKRLGSLRLGRYTAKAVVVYSDGRSDIPLISSYTFWVIPWTMLLVVFILLLVIGTGLFSWGRLLFRGTKKVRSYARRP
jgi:hypothetical protein